MLSLYYDYGLRSCPTAFSLLAVNTLEHVADRGKPNLLLRTSVYGTLGHDKQARLASCVAQPDPQAAGPSK